MKLYQKIDLIEKLHDSFRLTGKEFLMEMEELIDY